MLRLLAHPLVLVGSTLLVLVFAWSLRQTTSKKTASDSIQAQMAVQTELLEQKVLETEQTASEAGTPFAQEKILRNQLKLQKPGEVVIAVPPMPDSIATPEASIKPQPIEEWQNLLAPTN